jgi:hypothetical protein
MTAQNIYHGCPRYGTYRNRTDSIQNELKNRDWVKINPTEVSFDEFASLPKSFVYGKGIIQHAMLTAYVYNVGFTGAEGCNCKATADSLTDTHITLTKDAQHTKPNERVIVEVTPRVRTLMKSRGVDWSTRTLRKTLLHKIVTFTGFLFADIEHANASENDRPGGKHNWRRTVMELHPVTEIQIETGK